MSIQKSTEATGFQKVMEYLQKGEVLMPHSEVMPQPLKSHYTVLSVSPDASLAELHMAFRQRGFEAHPANGGSLKAFNEITSAFEVLCNSSTRQSHDEALAHQPCAAFRFRTRSHKEQALAHREPQPFLARLHELLRRLPPQSRREVIAQRLTQAQRLSLERWMMLMKRRLTLRGVAPSTASYWSVRRLLGRGRSSPSLSERSLCRHTAGGFRPTVHLVGGLYAQAGFSFDLQRAISALGALGATRALCRAALQEESKSEKFGNTEPRDVVLAFQHRVQAAFTEALRCCSAGQDTKFYFRTRVALVRGCELSTPMRGDLATALRDWHHLHEARAAATDPSSRIPVGDSVDLGLTELSPPCSLRAESMTKFRAMTAFRDQLRTKANAVKKQISCRKTPNFTHIVDSLERLLARERKRGCKKVTLKRLNCVVEHISGKHGSRLRPSKRSCTRSS